MKCTQKNQCYNIHITITKKTPTRKTLIKFYKQDKTHCYQKVTKHNHLRKKSELLVST